MPGSTMSLAYTAAPVSLSVASRRGTSVPTILFSDMLQLPLRRRGELAGRVEHRLDDLLVAGAAAEVAFDAVFDLCDARLGVVPEQLPDRHDHAAGAVPALHRVMTYERGLELGQLTVAGLALDRLHRPAVRLHGQDHAGVDGLPVQEHGACTALTGAAALLCPGQAEVVAQKVQQRAMLHDVTLVDAIVDGDGHPHHGTSCNSLRVKTSTMYARYSPLQRRSLIGSRTSSDSSTVRFTPWKNSENGTTRSPRRDAITARAPRHSSAGAMSEQGEAFTTLPTTVARLRIWYEARSRAQATSSG